MANPSAVLAVPVGVTVGAGLSLSVAGVLAATNPLQGYINALAISIPSTTTFTVAAGQAMSDDNTTLMTLGSAITKSTAGTWVAGTGNNGLDAGTIANTTWYHVFLIFNPTTVVTDVLFSTSASAPTLPTGYTKQRRIGSLRTGGAAALFTMFQNGDRFDYSAPVNTLNASAIGNTTANTQTLFVPTGVVVEAIVQAVITDPTNANTAIWFSSLQQTDTAVGSATGTVSLILDATNTFDSIDGMRIETNTSGQIRYRQSSTTISLYLSTSGYIDRRGRG